MELGLWLGRLITPPDPDSPAERLLAGVRLDLVTAIFDRTPWLPAWERAVQSAAPVVSAEIEARLQDAARISRYPAGKLGRLLPGPEDRQILANRLAAAGTGLEDAVSRFPAAGDGEIRLLCGALEAAWDRLVATADEELHEADRQADEIRRWKRPLWPLALGGAVLLALAGWVGLVLGGYLPSPAWFRPIADFIWSW
jgi:hypothetical protein